MKGFLLSIVVAGLCGGSATLTAQTGNAPASSAIESAQEPPSPTETETPARRRYWLFGSISTFYDTNADHNQQWIRSAGIITRIGFHFQNRLKNPSFEIEYEGALHRFANSDRFDRFSNRLSTSYRRKFLSRWSAKTFAEILLKGSPEDRELNDWYSFGETIECGLTKKSKLQAFAAYRLKRNPISNANDAIDSYVGGRFHQKFGSRDLDLSYRYDNNRSREGTNRFIRWRYDVLFESFIFSHRNRLSVEAIYVPVLFARTTKTKTGPQVLYDHQTIGEVQIERQLRHNVSITLFYRYEVRNSNNPNRNFHAHMTGATIGFRW